MATPGCEDTPAEVPQTENALCSSGDANDTVDVADEISTKTDEVRKDSPSDAIPSLSVTSFSENTDTPANRIPAATGNAYDRLRKGLSDDNKRSSVQIMLSLLHQLQSDEDEGWAAHGLAKRKQMQTRRAKLRDWVRAETFAATSDPNQPETKQDSLESSTTSLSDAPSSESTFAHPNCADATDTSEPNSTRAPQADAVLDKEQEEQKRERMRQEVIKEIVSTERAYIKDLDILHRLYIVPLTTGQIISPKEISQLFSNIKILKNVNSELLEGLEQMSAKPAEEQAIGKVFLKMADFFKTYTQYCANQPVALSTMESLQKVPAFADLLERAMLDPESRMLSLGSFLIKPVQRICKYPLLLKELLKYTSPTHPDFDDLSAALQKVLTVVADVNEKKRQFDQLQYILEIQHSIDQGGTDLRLVVPFRRLIRHGVVRTRRTNRERWKSRYCFLFSDLLLLTKKPKQLSKSGTLRLKRDAAAAVSSAAASESDEADLPTRALNIPPKLSVKGVVELDRSLSINSVFIETTDGELAEDKTAFELSTSADTVADANAAAATAVDSDTTPAANVRLFLSFASDNERNEWMVSVAKQLEAAAERPRHPALTRSTSTTALAAESPGVDSDADMAALNRVTSAKARKLLGVAKSEAADSPNSGRTSPPGAGPANSGRDERAATVIIMPAPHSGVVPKDRDKDKDAKDKEKDNKEKKKDRKDKKDRDSRKHRRSKSTSTQLEPLPDDPPAVPPRVPIGLSTADPSGVRKPTNPQSPLGASAFAPIALEAAAKAAARAQRSSTHAEPPAVGTVDTPPAASESPVAAVSENGKHPPLMRTVSGGGFKPIPPPASAKPKPPPPPPKEKKPPLTRLPSAPTISPNGELGTPVPSPTNSTTRPQTRTSRTITAGPSLNGEPPTTSVDMATTPTATRQGRSPSFSSTTRPVSPPPTPPKPPVSAISEQQIAAAPIAEELKTASLIHSRISYKPPTASPPVSSTTSTARSRQARMPQASGAQPKSSG